jgi:hypothetical protein
MKIIEDLLSIKSGMEIEIEIFVVRRSNGTSLAF